jgi:hypothetical protein
MCSGTLWKAEFSNDELGYLEEEISSQKINVLYFFFWLFTIKLIEEIK